MVLASRKAPHGHGRPAPFPGSRHCLREKHVKVLLLCSSFNGLSQRAWTELRGAGHDVRVQLTGDPGGHRRRGRTFEPDLIICPFLKERVPAEIWQRYRTIIIHPGPPGRPRAVLAGLGDQRRRSRAGASPRCRPSRRWTRARSGATARSRCPPTRRARAASTTARSPTPRSSWCTRWWRRPPTRSFRPRELVYGPRTCAAGCVR